ncbi:Retrotransposon gag protein [Corchorus olitorius]|uniref:Retrotransposon gag protein n=1 Tax=Corchorus olitorius TaxID=93759 RepID=A0A1R3FWA5_9ROSI|nr:Retrotransposon gag protein [Corchorus olitorius]
MPPRRTPGRGRGRGRPPLQRLPHRLPEDAEEESSVHSSPTNENLNVDPPPPPQWQQVPPPPCSPYEAFMDWRQRFETQIPQYEAAQPPVGQGQYVPPPPPVYGEFNKEYYSKFEKGRISGEFLALKQGDMSVSEYDNKLRRLFRHMPGTNEDLLCARFANGLAIDLQSSISSLITDTTRTVPYSHLVDTAKQAELVSQAARKTKQKSGFFTRFFKGKGKRQNSDSSFEPFSRKSRSSGSSDGASHGSSVGSPQASQFGKPAKGTSSNNQSSRRGSVCRNCRNDHDGPCPLPAKCFQCGSRDHHRRDCPYWQGTQTQANSGGRNFNTGRYTTAAHIASGREASGSGFNTRDRVQTRLYTMTREAAQDNPNSITGTVTLFRNYARALIDTGAEHSYVIYGFAQYADIPLSPLFPELIVQTPYGESLLKTEVYRECALLVGHMVFEADLIPLEIYDFDVILGMDWLNKHGAQIDCETKTMMLEN